jgi:polysaccharide pyruvyl transferase WcaK-like protein
LLVTLFAAVVYRAVPLPAVRRRLLSALPILDKLINATFVGDIRGGDSFSDIYGFKRFVSGSLPSLVALVAGRELILLPQTYGPLKTGLSRLLARQIFRGSKWVLARDKDSLVLANQLLNRQDSRSKIEFCPDVAFCLEPLMPAEPSIHPPLPDGSDYQLIGFNVSGLLYYGGYNQKNMFGLQDNYQETAFQVLQFLLSLPNTRILLLPHMIKLDDWNVENDLHASRHLLGRLDPGLRPRVHLAAGSYDQHQVKALIGHCEFFVGSRMHACIAALSQGIPAIGIAYSRKFKGLFETVGVPEAALDATRLSQDEIIRGISELHARADEIRGSLQKRLPEIISHTARCFATRFGALADGKLNTPLESKHWLLNTSN